MWEAGPFSEKILLSIKVMDSIQIRNRVWCSASTSEHV